MLGLNIKAIREFKKIGIQTIIKRLGIFPKKYLEIERGIVEVESSLLRKIANILDVGESDIINYNADEFNTRQKELDLRNNNLKSVENKGEIKKKPIIKPMLLTPSDIIKRDLSNQIYQENSFSAKDETDPFNFLIKTNDKSFSPRLINIVQPYNINGKTKTLFFTEFNTGLKVGDRVFIVNGVYDSNTQIKKNKYKRGRDGYKVLFIDKCKVVLDIDYNGFNPWKQEDPIIGYSVSLYYVKDEDDFRLVNRQITTSGGQFNNKFNTNNHNFIYVDKDYNSISGWGLNSGLLGSPGFFVRNGSNGWINVTNEFLLGNLTSVISPNLLFNGRIKVMDGEFTYDLPNGERLLFEEGKTYVYDVPDTEQETFPRWIVDIDYNRVFITKANFRNGIFKGEFNSGLFGNPDNEAKWLGKPASWNAGTFFNSFWEKGEFNSIFTLSESFFSEIDPNGNPIQKVNGFNNNGRGYSLIVDSIVDNMVINNATIVNSYFGESANYDVVSDYLENEQTEFNTIIRKGFFINCLFENSSVNNSLLQDSKTINSKLVNVRSISSQHTNVVIDNSVIVNDHTIRVIGYEELNMSVNSSLNDITHKVYKFYVSELDFNRLKFGDYFYLQNLKIDNDLINFFDKRFRVSSWTEYVDFYSGYINNLPLNIPNHSFYKRGIEMSVFLSTPIDNEMLYNSYRTSSSFITTITIEENPIKEYSIDIIVSTYDIDGNKIEINDKFKDLVLDYNRDRKDSTPDDMTLPNTLGKTLLFNNVYLVKGELESGIVNDTDWNNGNNIQSNKDLMFNLIDNLGGNLNMSLSNDKKLIVGINRNINYEELKVNTLKIGKIVFINSIYYLVNSEKIRLSDTYRIISVNDNELVLEEINNNILESLQLGGIFTTNVNNRYSYIHLSKINDSNIKKGFFNRSYLTNNNILNISLNIEDKDFNNILNIKELAVLNSLFDSNNNILDKALYLNCHFNISSIWKDGIIYKSTWENGVFNKGLFKSSNWENGVFNGGKFYQSNSFNARPNSVFQSIENNNIYTYFIKGETTPSVANNRWSWKNGVFNGGEFELSDYENGTFNNGLFIYSNFYDGVINDGIIGSDLLTTKETQVFNGIIENCIVINASLVAKDTSFIGNLVKSILWKNGVFNGGVFGNVGNSNSIWENGVFNGGEFTDKAKWKNGVFNGGKFNSTFGTSNPIAISDFTWENGVFNGGIFGNSDLLNNSNWFNGQFNDGKFIGRIWNNGIFTGGSFNGSGIDNVIVSISADEKDKLNKAQDFVSDFSSQYYGLWKNGLVSIEKDRFIKELNVENSLNKQAYFKNVLWENGIFSHSNGILENSVWLDGIFEKGTLLKSSFNPFVFRTPTILGFSQTALWKNGHLKESDFYFSEWLDGKFSKGSAFGMIWHKGVNEYMNAFNIWWKDGLWRNGNWYGSFIDYDGDLSKTDRNTLFYNAILKNINDKKDDDKVHLWNIFEELVVKKELSFGDAAVIQDSVPDLITYYGLNSCPNDGNTYYTDVVPSIDSQRYVKNNDFYFYNNNSYPLSVKPENFIEGLTTVSGATNCPLIQTYYEIQSCSSNELFYTNIPNSLSNQRYVDSGGNLYVRTQAFGITQNFQPANFIDVSLVVNEVGCSGLPSTNSFSSSVTVGSIVVSKLPSNGNFSIVLSGVPFVMSPNPVNQINISNNSINLSNTILSNDIFTITLNGTSNALGFSNLQIRDNSNVIYTGVISGGSGSNLVVTFNIGPAKGRSFVFVGGEVDIKFNS
jgi:transcriptional regulator with XRE-family HTH domain